MKRQILDVIFCSVRFSLLGFFLESLILSRISNSCGDHKDLSNVNRLWHPIFPSFYSDSFNSISASIIFFPDFTFQPENCTRIVSFGIRARLVLIFLTIFWCVNLSSILVLYCVSVFRVHHMFIIVQSYQSFQSM